MKNPRKVLYVATRTCTVGLKATAGIGLLIIVTLEDPTFWGVENDQNLKITTMIA